MRFYISILLLIASSSSWCSVTYQQARKVFAKVSNATGYHLILGYDSGLNSNAWAQDGVVVINQGMLNDVKNEAEVATVLGHEIAHYVRGDYRGNNSTLAELEADRIGVKYCQKAGYGNCYSWFYTAIKKYGSLSDSVHPTWAIRLKYVRSHR